MQGETIVCLATEAWDSLWRSTQQYMSRLARDNRVLYFEPGRRPDRRVFSEWRRNLRNFVELRPRQIEPNLVLIPTPPALPLARQKLPRLLLRALFPVVVRINAGVLLRQVRRGLRALNVRRPILWALNPAHYSLVGRCGERLAVYFNYDEFANFEQNERIKDMVLRIDDELTRRAGVVFATSRAQWSRRKAINPETHFMPNGVDFDLFNRALTAQGPLPADIAGAPRPVIGYAGWIGSQIEVDLLLRVAEAYPHGSLVMVGPDELPASPQARALHALPNVRFLGRKPREALPDYLRAFDVALIPYALRGFVLTAYPVKLHEYLAAGRAVVATAMPELQPYRPIVRIASDADDFVRLVSEALTDHSAESIAARVALARQHTWDRRMEEICSILDARLRANEQPAGGRRG
jgi:glycosyltransferase involved in cell wall biosynthesis